jgi:hypothetical protein
VADGDLRRRRHHGVDVTADDGRLRGLRPETSEDLETAPGSVGRLAVDHSVCYHGGDVEAGTERVAEVVAGE